MSFRKDINGLRAISVIAVVLFHFDSNLVPGGFIGVDVFFVISGFLMTSIITRGLDNDSFSLLQFYLDRVRRIVPALAFLCIVLLILGYFYLPPFDFQILGNHVSSSIAFLSNITYWKESGYFDSASSEKWLLHTWSLSAEWQFYLLYPIALIFLYRFFTRRNLKIIFLMVTIFAFIFSLVASYRWPGGAYYLLPVRAWEMMVGGVAFLFPVNFNHKIRKLLGATGLVLIFVSCIVISKSTQWPGYMALIPVLGAFLVIISNGNNYFWSFKLVENIGRYSYSIYLWHWPISVLFVTLGLVSSVFVFIGVLISIVFGFLSFAIIESRLFINRPLITFFSIIKYPPLLLAFFVFILGMSVSEKIININQHFDSSELNVFSEVSSSPYRDLCHSKSFGHLPPDKACSYFGDRISWAVLGDSHVVELSYSLANKLVDSNSGLTQFSFSGCIPSYGQNNSFSPCAKWTNEAVNIILSDEDIQNVVIGYRYSANIHNAKYKSIQEEMFFSLNNMITVIAKEKERVFVVLPIPEIEHSINTLIRRASILDSSFFNIEGIDKKGFEVRNMKISSFLNSQKFPPNVTLIDPSSLFCDYQSCFAVEDGTPLYFDNNHPSISGGALIAKEILSNY